MFGRSIPTVLSEREPDLPFSLEVDINTRFGDVAFYDDRPRYTHAWFSSPPVKSEFNRDFRPMNLNRDVYSWLSANMKKPWKAMYDYSRPNCVPGGAYYYIAFSDIADATLFKLKMSEWM